MALSEVDEKDEVRNGRMLGKSRVAGLSRIFPSVWYIVVRRRVTRVE